MSLTGVCISKCSELPQLEQKYRVCYGVVLVTLDTMHYKSKVIVITSLLQSKVTLKTFCNMA